MQSLECPAACLSGLTTPEVTPHSSAKSQGPLRLSKDRFPQSLLQCFFFLKRVSFWRKILPPIIFFPNFITLKSPQSHHMREGKRE